MQEHIIKVKQDGNAVPVFQTNATVSDFGATGFTVVGDREDFEVARIGKDILAEIIEIYDRELSSRRKFCGTRILSPHTNIIIALRQIKIVLT